MTNVTITLTEVGDGISTASTPTTITVYDGVFVNTGGGGGGAVSSVNGHTGAVVLTAADVSAATATQGAKADTAVQPGSLATVATSGAYSDLTGKPTLGTSAPLDVPASGNATSAQVVKGTDTRLSDARTPTAHTHAAADVNSGTLSTARIGSGTPAAGKYVDGGTGAWTALPAGGSGTVTSVTAADSTITVAGTAAAPTVKATTGTTTGTVAAGDDSRITGAAQKASNLSDLASASTARTNLGLGTAAVANKVAAGSAGVLDATDATTTNARTPTAHKSTHATAGTDALAPSDIGAVPTTRTVAGHALSADVTLSDSDISPVTPNTPTAGAYTFVLADANRLVLSTNNTSAATFTVPPNSSVAFPVGCALQVIQNAAGQITLAPGTAVTLNQAHGLKTSAQNAVVTLLKIATDTWVVTGDTTT